MRPFYAFEHGRQIVPGQRIQLSGGYEGAASTWLGGAAKLTATVVGFIDSEGSPPSMLVTLDTVHAAIKRRDGKACRAALAALSSPPPSDFRVASAHAVCEMIAGNCEGGIREQRALYVREGTPPDSAEIIASRLEVRQPATATRPSPP